VTNGGGGRLHQNPRHWRITDANGRLQEVRGAGVVGEQPVIKPGQNYEYTSGVPLPTPSGFMVGSYGMVTESGESFDIDIPAFSLDLPQEARTINCSFDARGLVWLEHIGRAAELAGHRNHPVLDHVVAVVLRQVPQHGGAPVARARDPGGGRRTWVAPHAALVEQPIEQALGRDRAVDQFVVLDRGDQRAAFTPGVVLRNGVRRGSLGC